MARWTSTHLKDCDGWEKCYSGRVMDDVELVTIEIFLDFNQGRLAHALLGSAGIPSSLDDENRVTPTRALGNPNRGLRLRVPTSFVETARQLLSSRVPEDELIAQAEAATEQPPRQDKDSIEGTER
jgi:hypothetical protein